MRFGSQVPDPKALWAARDRDGAKSARPREPASPRVRQGGGKAASRVPSTPPQRFWKPALDRRPCESSTRAGARLETMPPLSREAGEKKGSENISGLRLVFRRAKARGSPRPASAKGRPGGGVSGPWPRFVGREGPITRSHWGTSGDSVAARHRAPTSGPVP